MVLALPRGSVGHYIFISTTSVYAPTRSLPIRENGLKLAGPQPELGPAAGYGFQKWLAEQTVSTHARQLGFPCTCLRPSIIYGQYNYAPRERYFFDLIDQNQIVILPDNELALFQFVSVWDVAEIITLMHGQSGDLREGFQPVCRRVDFLRKARRGPRGDSGTTDSDPYNARLGDRREEDSPALPSGQPSHLFRGSGSPDPWFSIHFIHSRHAEDLWLVPTDKDAFRMRKDLWEKETN